MNKKFYGYHGDLDFFKLDKLPEGAKFIGKFKHHVAQEGETTGHMHRIKSDQEFEVYQIEEIVKDETIKRWLYLLNAPAEISHEEHRTHVLEPGIYYQNQENEENAQTGMIQRVVD